MPNRRITLTGVAYALGESHAKIRAMVLAGKLEAWVYKGLKLVPYQKLDRARHPMIYVYEDQLGKFQVVNPLPPIENPLPPGKLLLKKGAAALLGCTPHWIQQRAESGKIRAFVYDERGVNLIPLPLEKGEEAETGRAVEKRNARVLHFLESDVKAYKKKIAEYQTEPLSKRPRPNLTEQQKQQAIMLASTQMSQDHYVVMKRIREALGIPNQYDDALRRLRQEFNWPLKHHQASESRTKIR